MSGACNPVQDRLGGLGAGRGLSRGRWVHGRAGYVHGYAAAEERRLNDQASTLEALLHLDTGYPAGSAVLEAGCGVGAQTVPLVRQSPGAAITCLDISAGSLAAAAARVRDAGLPLPAFREGDICALPFADGSFDHVFVCFVLEHVRDPAAALAEVRRVLRPGGSVTVIEGDHGSVLFHPDDAAARAVVGCQVALQRAAGGDSEIGRRVFPLLAGAGFGGVRGFGRGRFTSTRRGRGWWEGFIRRTFVAMVAGVREEAVRAGLMDGEAFDTGVRGLLRTAEADGVFCYTFFKGVGVRG